jgi:hypothetical protein
VDQVSRTRFTAFQALTTIQQIVCGTRSLRLLRNNKECDRYRD